MASKIADLLPAPIQVPVSDGKALTLRHLELQEVVMLLFSYSDDFLAMYAESQTDMPNYMKFLTLAPELCATVISLAADDKDNAKDYRRLPFAVQLIALEQIWKASVPDPKAFGEMLKKFMSELKHLSELEEKEEKPAQPAAGGNKPQ